MESSTSGGCEIGRLPEELLASIIMSLAPSPRDVCRAAAVSRAFRAAADSDAVWSRLLPRDLPRFAKKELPRAPPSKKGLFRRLSDQPALLPGKLMCMRLDRVTAAKCYTFSARALRISWGNTSCYWRWIPLGSNDCIVQRGKRFSEAAELLRVCWLEIRGKIDSKMLSRNTAYTAYMLFKLAKGFYGLHSPHQEASVIVGGSESMRQVCLQGCVDDNGDRRIFKSAWSPTCTIPLGEDLGLPRKRADGWMELELGEFYNEEGDDGEVSISLKETKGGHWKRGLIVYGIEIRTKKQA